ncbi:MULTISPECIES: ornithine carbamoyltransferase [unclassified Streptomyces]|uniref:ornithine carbamoyltransferase n=1 Tax=unclassified Streptomyces TaxID=2593676 RepID=UPI002258A616|nr:MULTISPECIES: ornithine carbamoyltransferase [unclassified Streptomyces]MCX4992714.1 ornithine carbamoyltransferase [Streptomyces sp. NBC_00568]MCX5002049.1 ornithine carbamoyltransferase [Streptomyces sp. NBC_00638]
MGSVRHLISITDLTDDELRGIVARGVAFATGERARTMDGAVVGVYFRRTSTRTRTAFTAGALRLGAQTVTFGPADLQTNTGETSEDTGRVFAGMLDLLVARTADATEELRTWAAAGDMSVVNAMSAEEHPTQGLTDLTTLQRHFGRVDGIRLLYVGEGNNSAAALALALTRFPGTELELRTPPGYGVAPDVLARATEQAARSGAKIVERHDMSALPADLDAVYTTRWQTTGTSKPTEDWREVFAPFQVTRALWEGSPKAVFLHDLPAHRGEEVTAEVLDGPTSIAFTQATHKLHSAMAVLEWCWAGSR